MEKFNIYEHDMQGVSVNDGFVAKLPPSDRERTAFIATQHSVSIVLNIEENHLIGSGDIVTNSWVHDFLNVKPSDEVHLEPVDVTHVTTLFEVELTFVSYQSQVGWSDAPHTGPMKIPFLWSSVWPQGCKANVLERNASILLAGSVLYDGAILCMRVLDSLMVTVLALIGRHFSYLTVFVCFV